MYKFLKKIWQRRKSLDSSSYFKNLTQLLEEKSSFTGTGTGRQMLGRINSMQLHVAVEVQLLELV